MHTSWVRRLGVIAVIVLIFSAILVPAASAGGTCPSGGSGCRTYYTVRRGDNLTRIAARFGTSVSALQRCNGIWNPDKIYVGQTLCICGGWQPCPPPRPKPQPQPCPPPKPVPPPCPYPCQSVPHPIPPGPSGPWHAWYWNNTDLSGSPVFEQNVSSVNFNWGYGSPGPGVQPDFFSARFQEQINIATGTYRVTVSSDDGVRVSIDNVLVVNDWQVQALTTTYQDVIITGGSHLITIEYFEDQALAELHFSLTPLPTLY